MIVKTQVPYLDKWVDRKHFAAFIYRADEQRLTRDYDEFVSLIGTGTWFATKEQADAIVGELIIEQPVLSTLVELSEPEETTKKETGRRERIKNQLKSATLGS